MSVRYNKVPHIKVNASIEEAVKAMIVRQSPVLHVTGNNGEPLGWLNSLDILRVFMEDPGAAEFKKRDIRGPMRTIAEEDYLDVTGKLSEHLISPQLRGLLVSCRYTDSCKRL